MTRAFHSLTTRYNVYHNGHEAYLEALKGLEKKAGEDYSQLLPMCQASVGVEEGKEPGGAFDPSIEKAQKAVREHSIVAKPKRKRGKNRDPEYVEWMSREEYNPFIHNVWLMMGESQFMNGDFLEASATFSYITRRFAHLPEVVMQAKLWRARSYIQLDWLYEAEDIFHQMQHEPIPYSQRTLYANVRADLLLRSDSLRQAVPYLLQAIEGEKRRANRVRYNYILGQLYAQQGDKVRAYKAFGKVVAMAPPFNVEFNARIRQSEVYADVNADKVLRKLRNMSRRSKYADYLDQVHYAMGNIYLQQPDTATALEQYALAIEKSTRGGIDKAIVDLRAGEIYFHQRHYDKAQPLYSEATTILPKDYPGFAEIDKRSKVLDELAIHATTMQLQDSLQRLAQMTEVERLAVIDRLIEEVIEAEKKEREEAEREEMIAEQESRNAESGGRDLGMATAKQIVTGGGDGSWYFYSAQSVTTGRNEFQRKWGRRKNEDNWRRKNKSVSTFEALDENIAEQDDALTDEELEELTEGGVEGAENASGAESASGAEGAEGAVAAASADSVATDNKSREFYLQQIPFSDEDLAASDALVEDALFKLSMLYKDKLEDFSLAIESFGDFTERFPASEQLLEAYYQQWLIYMRMQDQPNADRLKGLLLAAFPESEYAVAISNPDYLDNMRKLDAVQEELYQRAYGYYQVHELDSLRAQVAVVQRDYPLASLMPKFLFLDALSYVVSNEPDTFQVRLKHIVDTYPDADVTALAGDMLKHLLDGRELATDKATMRGMEWNLTFGDAAAATDSIAPFVLDRMEPHAYLLLYPAETVNSNNLLFGVAAFNFSRFIRRQSDLSMLRISDMEVLHMQGFLDLDDVMVYDELIYADDGYANELPETMFAVPISESNYKTLNMGRTLSEYFTFVEDSLGQYAPALMARWQRNIEANKRLAFETAETADRKVADVEAAPAAKPDASDEAENELPQVPIEDPTNPEEWTRHVALQRDTARHMQQYLDSFVVQRAAQLDSLAGAPIQTVPDTLALPDDTHFSAPSALPETTLPLDVRQAIIKQQDMIEQLEHDAEAEAEAKEQARKDLKEEKEKQAKEKKRLREEELKAKEKQRRETMKKREEELKAKEKERDELLKKKKKERRELERQRDKELRAKEKLRKEQLRAKEAARKEALRAKEESRKAEAKAKEEARKAANKK